MLNFFASLYEWWGLNPLYSSNLGDHLRGFDLTCSSYTGTPWYSNIGTIMILIIIFFFSLYYHIIDSPRFQRRIHWMIIVLIACIINILIAFLIPYNALRSGDYCNQLVFTASDCFGFGISNGIWSIIIFILLSLSPFTRKYSRNCSLTPWKQ